MNYYDEILDRISLLIDAKEYDDAKDLINIELNVPYIPKEFENQLNEYLLIIKDKTSFIKNYSDEELIDMLNDDSDHQLIAINELDKRNLRDYIDICFGYLSSDGFINAKVLLIDSLIKQEINYEFVVKKDNEIISFNPYHLIKIEDNIYFNQILNKLDDYYLKEPSKLILAKQLLYKDVLMFLPYQYEDIDVNKIFNKIINYINNAFIAK